MSAPIYLQARREARTRDARSVVESIVEGSESLLTLVSGWPLTTLREGHIVSAERSLVALQVLLCDLRRHVPASGAK
jgi:hypothetical protein